MLGPGRVRPGGEGTITLPEDDAIHPFQKIFSKAGFEVDITQDLSRLLWTKLIVNAAINPVTALFEIPNGKLFESSAAMELSIALAEETARVGQLAGVDLAGVDPAGLVRTVAEKTAANHSSMLQDIQRGAPTEIEAICGANVLWRSLQITLKPK